MTDVLYKSIYILNIVLKILILYGYKLIFVIILYTKISHWMKTYSCWNLLQFSSVHVIFVQHKVFLLLIVCGVGWETHVVDIFIVPLAASSNVQLVIVGWFRKWFLPDGLIVTIVRTWHSLCGIPWCQVQGTGVSCSSIAGHPHVLHCTKPQCVHILWFWYLWPTRWTIQIYQIVQLSSQSNTWIKRKSQYFSHHLRQTYPAVTTTTPMKKVVHPMMANIMSERKDS